MMHDYFQYQEVKLSCPDYNKRDHDEAIQDFYHRIENYKLAYEPLDIVKDK